MGGLREGVFLPLLSVLCGAGTGLEITNIEVPGITTSGATVRLSCSFILRVEDDLYSLTWWKDEHMFYKFVPKNRKPKNVYKMPGIVVDERHSSLEEVAIKVDHRASGQLRCEVLSDYPYFEKDARYANMTVLDLPESKPTITGQRKSYRAGELLLVNCSSPYSFPPSHLTWYINSKLASHETVVFYPRERTPRGCEASWSGLQMPLTRHHFQDGVLNITCTAAILQRYNKSAEVEIMDANYIPSPPQEGASTGGMECVNVHLVLLVLLVLLASLGHLRTI